MQFNLTLHISQIPKFGLMRLVSLFSIRLHGLRLLDLAPPPLPLQHTRLDPQSWSPLGLLSPATRNQLNAFLQFKIMLSEKTSDASSSTLGMGSIMISSSLGLLALDEELFSLFWAVLLSSLLTSAAAPGTLRLNKRLIYASVDPSKDQEQGCE